MNDNSFLLWLLDALSWIIYYIVGFIGELIGVVVSIFISIVGYNNFLNEEPVLIGWTIIRDLCNMGFVVILLIIAISSILQIERYGYKNRLFKLLMMAVLINFSKMFTGLLIDASQYVMLEFAVGINAIGGGNFMDILGINKFLMTDFDGSFDGTRSEGASKDNIELKDLFVTVLLALVLALVALIVVAALTIVIIIRIVALWILIILSPVAYLLAFSPMGSKYASQWWAKFTQWTVTGPVMLFFVWLSLATLKGVMDGVFSTTGGTTVGIAEIGSAALMGSFLLAIVFLMASLMVAQQLGGIAGKVAGGAYSMISNKGEKLVRGGIRGALGGTKMGADYLNRKAAINLGTPDLNLKRKWKTKFAPALDRMKNDDLYKIDSSADDRYSKKGGFTGYVGSLAYGTSNVEESLRGFMASKSIGRALATSKIARPFGGKTAKEWTGERKKYDDDIQKRMNDRGGIVSESEYANLGKEHKAVNEEIERYELDDQNITAELKLIKEAVKKSKKEGEDGMAEHNGISLDTEALEAIKKQKEGEREKVQETIKINQGDKDGIVKRQADMQKRIDNGSITVESDDVAEKKRSVIDNEIEGLKTKRDYARNKQIKYTIDDTEVKKAKNAKRREEGAKLGDTQEELIQQYEMAMQNGKHATMEAVLLQLSKNNDLNEILQHYGYNSSIGLSEKEISKMREDGVSEDEIKSKRGFHDFMRDSMRDKAGRSENSVFELQSDMAQILKHQNAGAFAEAVDVEGGQYVQRDSRDQQALASVHINKQDKEKTVRNATRFAIGGENANGNFIPHAAGLDFIKTNHESFSKEIKLNRLSPMLAKKLSETESMKILERTADTMDEGEARQFKSMLSNLKTYAGSSSGKGFEDFQDKIEQMTDVINDEKDNSNSNTSDGDALSNLKKHAERSENVSDEDSVDDSQTIQSKNSATNKAGGNSDDGAVSMDSYSSEKPSDMPNTSPSSVGGDTSESTVVNMKNEFNNIINESNRTGRPISLDQINNIKAFKNANEQHVEEMKKIIKSEIDNFGKRKKGDSSVNRAKQKNLEDIFAGLDNSINDSKAAPTPSSRSTGKKQSKTTDDSLDEIIDNPDGEGGGGTYML
jgi:hypothetical protein